MQAKAWLQTAFTDNRNRVPTTNNVSFIQKSLAQMRIYILKGGEFRGQKIEARGQKLEIRG